MIKKMLLLFLPLVALSNLLFAQTVKQTIVGKQTQPTKVPPYPTLKLFDLATAADVITYGTISKVDSQYFYLNCSVAGKRNTIKLPKYKNKKGALRWAPYEEGQQVFVFLKKVGKEYTLYSSGPESEIPMVKDTVVVDMQYFNPKTVASLSPKGITDEYKAAQTFEVGKRKVFGLQFNPKYLLESMEHLRNCYQVLLKTPNTNASYHCFNFFDRYTNDKINGYKNRNRLMRLLYADMELTQKENCFTANNSAKK